MIACLAWGSLVWDPRELEISSDWFSDGPKVPVEFARQSEDGRLTLVIGNGFQYSPSLWVQMTSSHLDDAIESLRKREETSKRHIAYYQQGSTVPNQIPEIESWSGARGIDAVIWTGLPPKFHGEVDRVPSIEEAIKYLSTLDKIKKQMAEEYVRRTPQQIKTPYRFQFERNFGWYPIT